MTQLNPEAMASEANPRASVDSFEHVPSPRRQHGQQDREQKARLIYCKSHVAIHPTQLRRDNISGLLGLVEVDREENAPRVPESAPSAARAAAGGKEVLVVWVPDELLRRMSEEDRRSYQRVEERPCGTPAEDDGYVFVSLPAPRGEKYAFSVPVSQIYSILVYPPSLSHWYGSATFNLLGGLSLPTLYFHDDQTPLVTTPRSSSPPPPPWGFPPFLNVLKQQATLLRSRLITASNNRGGELWLVNPSKSDREVHEAGYDDPYHRPSSTVSEQSEHVPTQQGAYPPRAASYPTLSAVQSASPRDSLLIGLSNITNMARHTAQNVLNHPLARPVVPHLPPAFRSLVNAPGEWEAAPRPRGSRSSDVASEFEAARLYLARWARVVAEEGERSRRDELASQAGRSESGDDLTSLGVFSLLPSAAKRPMPKPTRTPNDPITLVDWERFMLEGRDEAYVRREIFRRGFTDSPEPDQMAVRREGWEVLLGVVPWDAGWVGGGEDARAYREKARAQILYDKRTAYTEILSGWREKTKSGEAPDAWREEWHRIDVDCRRTDRTQPIYAFEAGEEPATPGGSGNGIWGEGDKEEEGGHAPLNANIAALRTVLMSYHVNAPELGYVQGMSDLLSPIYYVFDCNEADAYWGLVGVMKIMEANFLRDQSGMRRQLSTLQQLIQLMDPELYAHLEKTESLNLFFCFRWILIAFKREFRFETIIKLWEVLWTNYYSDRFVLFITLAVLQSHRDVIIRYLAQFDEVLKYANDLSGTIDLDTTLAQAEVLFLQFRTVVEEIDKECAADAGGSSRSPTSASALEARKAEKRISPELRELLDCWAAKAPPAP